MRTRTGAAAIAVLVAAVATGGCEAAQEKLTETALEKAIESADGAEGVEVELDLDAGSGEGGFTVTSSEGTMGWAAGGEVPADWPDDVPVIDHDEVVASSVLGTGDGRLLTLVVATSHDEPAEATAWYVDALGGWEQESAGSHDTPPVSEVTLARGDVRVGVVALGQPDHTQVTIKIEERS